MKLEQLLTKWALMGLINSTTTQYSTFNGDNQSNMIVKLSIIKKDCFVAYVTYRETYNPDGPKHLEKQYGLINADVASELFNIGPLMIKARLTDLDEMF